MKRLIVLVLSLCMTLGMVACSSNSNIEGRIASIEPGSTATETNENNFDKVQKTEEPIANIETSPTVAEVTEDPFDEVLNAIEGILTYPNISITHDGTSVTVQYWYSGLAQAVDLAIDGDEDKEALWTSYVESEKAQCTTMCDMLAQRGFTDCSVTWIVLDDTDTESILLEIVDGEVVYNVVG